MKNPWPNVDAHSGVLLQVIYYIFTYYDTLKLWVTVLWSQRNELLHCTVRSLKSTWSARGSRLGPCPRLANRKAQIIVHRQPNESLEGLIFSVCVIAPLFIDFFSLSHHFTVGKNM